MPMVKVVTYVNVGAARNGEKSGVFLKVKTTIKILSRRKFQFSLSLHVDVKIIRGKPFPTPNTFITFSDVVIFLIS